MYDRPVPSLPVAEIRDLNKRAVTASVGVVAEVRPGDLGQPTPCDGWTLGDLLAHMIAQHHGFAAAALGDGADLSHWQVRPVGAGPAAEYAGAADRVLAAFADEGVPGRGFLLPEFTTDRTFPAAEAIGFHFIDYVVHSWDVARTLGAAVDLDAEVLDVALAMARDIPDGPGRLVPGAPFRPAVPVSEGAGPLDEIVALLGRSPTWPD